MAWPPQLDPENRTWEAIACATMMAICYAAGIYRLWPRRAVLKDLAIEIFRSLRPCKPKAAAISPVEQRIKEECEKRHLQRADLLLVLGNFSNVGQGFFYMLNIFTYRPVINMAQVFAFYPVFIVMTVASLFPRALTPRRIDALYCFFMLGWMAFLLVHNLDGCWINEHRASTMVVTIYWGLFNLSPVLNLLACIGIASCETVMMTLAGHSCLCVWASYSLVFMVLTGIEYILRQGVRLEIVGTDSDNELTAVKTLLKSICDVIVQLDGNLRLKQHSPMLADVLLQGPSRNFEGADLRDLLVSEEDRNIFTEHMHSVEETQAHADVFHAKMRDSSGAHIAMEFFSVAFKGTDAQQHHYLGMREYTDIAPVVKQPPLPPPKIKVVMPKERPDVAWAGTPAAVEPADIKSHASSRSGSRDSKASDRHGSRGSRKKKEKDETKAPTEVVYTKDIAKLVSINYMLMGWSVEPAEGEGDCCAMHAALRNLQSSLPKLISLAKVCNKSFKAETGWQCQRCGICADEWKDPKHKSSCRLCQDVSREQLEDGPARGGKSMLEL